MLESNFPTTSHHSVTLEIVVEGVEKSQLDKGVIALDPKVQLHQWPEMIQEETLT